LNYDPFNQTNNRSRKRRRSENEKKKKERFANMASIFKPTYTHTNPDTGEKTQRPLSKWYIKFRDADGILRKVPGYTDKSATRQLAAELERKAALQKIGISDPFERHRKRALAEHVADFENHLRDKGNSKKHVTITADRVRRTVEHCRFTYIDDIAPSPIEAYLAELRTMGIECRDDKDKRRKPLSIETSNHYLTAVKVFCRWLVIDRRMASNPIVHLKKLNSESDRRHDRRCLDPSEFSKLIEAAGNGPIIEGMAGPDRAMLYIVAAWTGYRRKELASLTLASFDLESEPPTVRVEASYSKRGRTDSVPLHSAVVDRIKAWLATKAKMTPQSLVFDLRTPTGDLRKTSKMMERDLEGAGIAYRDERGLYADFHSNRHTFVSNLARAGVSPKMAQTLARHSDINLTMNTYTHVAMGEQASAMQELPAPPTFAIGDPNKCAPAKPHVPNHVPPADSPWLKGASVGPAARDSGQEPTAIVELPKSRSGRLCRSLVLPDPVGKNERCQAAAWSSNPQVVGSIPTGRA
jgi:integrase